MLPLSAADAIGPAFTHAREVLGAGRFQLARFYKLALVAALSQATFLSVAGVYPLQGVQFATLSRLHRAAPQQFAGGGAVAAVGIIVLLVALVVGVLVSLGLLYVFCRMRATLFDLVVERGGRVRAAWRRHPKAARRYFGLYLLVVLAWACVLAASLGPFFVAFLKGSFAAARAGGEPGALPAAMTSQMLVLAGLSWLLLPVWLAIDALLQDFILPSLALEPELSMGAAFARLRDLARRSPGQLALFLLLRMLVGLGIGLALMLVTLIVAGLLGLAGFGMGKLLYTSLWTGGVAARTLFFAALAGIVLVIYALYLFAVIAVYGITGVFKTSYAALFFAGYYPALAAHLYPAPPEAPPTYASPLPQQLW